MFPIIYVSLAVALNGILEFELQYSGHTKNHKRSYSRRETITETLINGISGYTIQVAVGTPPKYVELLVDTSSGASLTMAQSADIYYVSPVSPRILYDELESTTSGKVFGSFEATHESNIRMKGIWTVDTIILDDYLPLNLTFGLIRDINIGLQAKNRLLGGILGLGLDEEISSLPCDDEFSILHANLPKELKRSGQITYKAYSIWLNAYNRAIGTLVFGAVDSTLMTSDLYRFPLVPTFKDKISYFSIKASAFFLVHPGNWQEKWAEVSTPVMFNTGCSISTLPKQIMLPFLESLDAHKINGEWMVECSKLSNGGGIGIVFSGVEFVFPFKDIAKLSSTCKKYCIPGFRIGEYPVIGDNILRSLYVVYDLERKELGIALANTMKFGPPDYKKIIVSIPCTKAPLYHSTEMDYKLTPYEIKKFSIQTPHTDENGNIRVGLAGATGLPRF